MQTLSSRPSVQQLRDPGQAAHAALRTSIEGTPLPPRLLEHLARYHETGGRRHGFVWNWVWHILTASDPTFVLSSAQQETRANAALAKNLFLLAVTISDDVADEDGDTALVADLVALLHGGTPRPAPTANHRATLDHVAELLAEAHALCIAGPSHATIAPFLDFDLRQVWNNFSHAVLVNGTPAATNLQESLTYGGHNMMMLVFADIDLCFSPAVDPSELGRMRDAFLHAQVMARVGNWVTTWRREIPKGDYTSGMFAGLAGEHPTSVARWLADPAAATKAIESSGMEASLLERWTTHRAALLSLAPHIQTFSVTAYVAGLEDILRHHFASEGLK